jgi:hypothetical protein
MIANKIVSKDLLTLNQKRLYDANSDILQFFRRNPVIACEELLGIKLYDQQAWLLQETWVSEHALWLLSRNGSKTVMGGIYLKLRTLLFEEQEFWIVSKTGKQARRLFNYIEDLTLNKMSEFASLKDIYYNEMYRPNDSLTGFSHDPSGFTYTLLNNSKVTTLNGISENNRGGRGSVFFDEIGFMQTEQVVACEAFATTDASQKTSIDKLFSTDILSKQPPLQLIYASSASDMTTYYFDKYKTISKNYWAGDRRYFLCDIDVTVPLAPRINGKEMPPLLNKTVVESAMQSNPTKAMREFYNRFDRDGGDAQIIKSHTIENNSTFILPELKPVEGAKYIFGYDSAHLSDNSIFGTMKVTLDKDLGYVGDIVNMINFKDLSIARGNRQMLFQDQIEEVREQILRYNGKGAEYENIIKVAIDSGMGGGGGIYGSNLMFDWTDRLGIKHRGMIDKGTMPQEIQRQYPNAYNIINLVEPTKWKSIMVERLMDLMELGVIRMPVEYNNSGSVDIEDEDGNVVRKKLDKEEILALINIDLMKEETKMIHKFKSGEKMTYKLRADMQNKMNDDKFFVLCLMANELWMLRESDKKGKHTSVKSKDRTVLKLFN